VVVCGGKLLHGNPIEEYVGVNSLFPPTYTYLYHVLSSQLFFK
jgi:hypothetical protein